MRTATFLLLSCLAAALIGLGTDPQVNVYDEGIILLGASRVAAGEVLHRDFYANYGPGQFYVLAALFDWFGEFAWVGRLWDMAVKGAIAAMACIIVARATSLRLGLLACVLTAAFLVRSDFAGYPVYPALLSSLVGVWLMQRFMSRGRMGRWLLFGSGAASGVAALFRYDIGFLACLAGLASLGCWVFAARTGDQAWSADTYRFPATYAVGASAVVLPLLVVYAVGGFLHRFVFDVITFPAENYARMRSLPFPRPADLLAHPADLLIYLPVLAAAAAASVVVPALVRRLTRPRQGGGGEPAMGEDLNLLLILLPLTCVFFIKGCVRVSIVHMALSIVPAILMLVVVALRPVKFRLARFAIALLACAMLALPLKEAGVELEAGFRQYAELWRQSCDAARKPERLRCLTFPENRVQAILYVQARVLPSDTLFVGTGRHDKIFANDVASYFLSGLRPATRWHHYDPGLQTTQPIQQEMVEEVERHKPPFVILSRDWDEIAEPNDSAASTGVTVLDEYLERNYRRERVLGTVEVLRRIP